VIITGLRSNPLLDLENAEVEYFSFMKLHSSFSPRSQLRLRWLFQHFFSTSSLLIYLSTRGVYVKSFRCPFSSPPNQNQESREEKKIGEELRDRRSQSRSRRVVAECELESESLFAVLALVSSHIIHLINGSYSSG
jgi:hypothetical protein